MLTQSMVVMVPKAEPPHVYLSLAFAISMFLFCLLSGDIRTYVYSVNEKSHAFAVFCAKGLTNEVHLDSVPTYSGHLLTCERDNIAFGVRHAQTHAFWSTLFNKC